MAFNLLRVCNSLTKSLKQTLSATNCLFNNAGSNNLIVCEPLLPQACQARLASFFTKRTADTLWKSVTSVSNAGRNRGRGKGLTRKIRDLNKGQYIGVGKINMQWPGLTAPIMRGTMLLKQQRLPDDPERHNKMIKMRDTARVQGWRRVHPLERGWTSAKMGGKSIGPPDPVNDETFDGFDTKVLEHKIVNHMTGNLGRKRTYSSFVITGNHDGLVGIALGRSPEGKNALRIAKNRAGAKLMYIRRYNDHTVYHDFFAQFGSTKLYVFKKPEGYGLKCHRALKCACEVMGIKDLRVKIEGAMNYQNIIKAFLVGLLKQKTHQELAEEKKLHLVEMRSENLYYPKVVASPTVLRTRKEIPSTEIMDFTQYVMGGKVVLHKVKPLPFYVTRESYNVRLRKLEYIRNQDKVRLRMFAEHGELRSFYTDQYPECKPKLYSKLKLMQEKAKQAQQEEAS